MGMQMFFKSLMVLLVGLPLCAQLDPRLQMSTDSLDVYKENGRKAQIISVLDMSGSMTALSNHQGYKTNRDQNLNIGDKYGPIRDGRRVVIACKMGAWVAAKSHQFDGQSYNVQVALPELYDLEYNDQTGGWKSPSLIPMTGVLVEEVTQKPFDLASLSLPSTTAELSSSLFERAVKEGQTLKLYPSYARFVERSSHARMKSSTYNRTVDLPIPWKLFDAPEPALAQSKVLDKVSNQFLTVDKNINTGGIVNGHWVIAGDAGVYGGALFNYNPDYLAWIFSGKIQESSAVAGWSNGLPAMTRCHAVKWALLRTWVDVQHQVLWAYRFLDEKNEKPLGTNISTDNEINGRNERSLRLMEAKANGGVPDFVVNLAEKKPGGGTPLTYALANAYAQMMDGKIFEGRFNEECTSRNVLLFTDGQANDTEAKGDPLGFHKDQDTAGWLNTEWIQIKSKIDPGKDAFNIWTLAGLAAHGFHKELDKVIVPTENLKGLNPLSRLAPFGVSRRRPDGRSVVRNINTMTIGVGLPGEVNEPGSPKRDMLLAAGYGNELNTAWNNEKFEPYSDAIDGKKTSYFFDTKTPAELVVGLKKAIGAMDPVPASLATPVAPSVGLRAGTQIYLPSFIANNSTKWMGDLCSVSYAVINKEIKIIGKQGKVVDDKITSANAHWSASELLKSSNKKIFTYFGEPKTVIPGENPHSELNVSLTESKWKFDDANPELVNFIIQGNEGVKEAVKTQLAAMRDTTDFGDVINSSPVVFEYSEIPSVFGTLPKEAKNEHFRVIFVGTNHGFLHAIGEHSFEVKDSNGNFVHAATAKELWRFVPKDFLRGKNAEGKPTLGAWHQLQSGQQHVYMVDGPMVGYLDEERSKSGRYQSIDKGTEDRGILIFRLGKGGRSTYALDITDPESPTLNWAVIPDDEPATQAQSVIAHMGLATGAPGLSRVLDTGESRNPVFRDLVFLNGGLSTDEIDNKFSQRAGRRAGEIKLGRSVMALDTLTGKTYQSWNLLDFPTFKDTVGSIPASVVPFEMLKRSNMTQRVYFSDRSGGVFALGSGLQQEKNDSNPGFYLENSDPKCWTDTGKANGKKTVRKIWQAGPGEYITTSPVPFRPAKAFPGKPLSEKMMAPQAIGVAVGTGDLWDPMDLDDFDPHPGKPKGRHTFAVLFDRNDSAGTAQTGIPQTNLADLTAGLQVGASYKNPLEEKDGFYILLNPAKEKPRKPNDPLDYGYEKVISEALVLRNVLYFPVFDPVVSSGLDCMTGVTRVFRIGDVMNPTWSRNPLTDPKDHKATGEIFLFSGVAGRLTAFSESVVGAAGNLVSEFGQNKPDGTKHIQFGTDYQPVQGPAVRMTSWRIVR